MLDERARRIHARGAQPLARAEFLQVAREQPRHLDHRRAVLGERRHIERLNDRVVIGILHRHRDRLVRVGGQAVVDAQQQHPVALQLPPDHLVHQLSAAVARARRRLGDLRVPQQVLAKLALRNLVVIAFFDLVDREQSLRGLRILGDHAVVRLRIGHRGSARAQPAPPPTARRRLRRYRRLVLGAKQTSPRTPQYANLIIRNMISPGHKSA